ncbi:MAG: hypothetical protein RIC53_08550 [Cyclobacteriaceae bacterium]
MNHRLQLPWVIGLVLIAQLSFGQNSVGIGTSSPNTNAVLHLVSPGGNQGFIVPQLTTPQRTAASFTDNLGTNEGGLLVFDTDESFFYYWDGTAWLSLSAQTLLAGTGISIDANGSIINVGDLDSGNEIQDLALVNNTLTITENGNATSIDLTPFLDNTDSQSLSFTNDQLSVSGGNSIDLSALKDGTGTDDQIAEEVSVTAAGNLTSTNVQDALIEIQTDVDGFTDTDDQTLSFLSNSLTISEGNSVDLGGLIDDADADPTNEIQDLSLASNALTITNNASASTIDLSPYLDNTDDQVLDLTSDQLSISGGNSIDLSVLKDGTGTDDQTASEVNVTVSGNLTSTNVQSALTELQSDIDGFTDTDDQTLSFASNSLTISEGNSVDLSGLIDDADADATNELQDLNLSDNVLTITGLTSPTSIDLSTYIGNNTDNQTLTFSSGTLQISGGNSVDLSSLADGYEPNTDSQNLLFSDNLLTISGGSGSVDMSGFLDNTDEQSLTFNTSTNLLTILDGNSVDLSTLKDGTGTDNQTLSLSTNTLSISGGNGISLASFKDNTDNQSLSYNSSSKQLTISGGNSVTLTQTAYQTLRPSDFIPVSPVEGNTISLQITDNGNVGNFFAAGSLDGKITADLDLPDGARVESIAVHAARGSQSKNAIDVYLYSSQIGGVSTTTIESGQISSTAITELKLTPSDLTIDNSKNVYFLVIDGEAGSTRNNYDRVLHVLIAYSY